MKKRWIILGLIVFFLIGVIIYFSNTKNQENDGENQVVEKKYFNILNSQEITEFKTKKTLNEELPHFKNRFNNVANAGYVYTIKTSSFKIDNVQVDCKIIEENNIQYIKLPFWFTRYFETPEKIQLDKKYDINMETCILELTNINVEKNDEYDVWDVQSYSIYEQEETKVDFEVKCIGQYFDKKHRTDIPLEN